MDFSNFKSGYVAIVGKPNAGKSTLMNALLGTKLSIATHKAQTTRHQVMGIFTDENQQIVFLDTPGLIIPKYKLQEYMMQFVQKAKKDADVIVLMVDVNEHSPEDFDFSAIADANKPVILAINKMDLGDNDKANVLIAALSERYTFDDVIKISALQNQGLDQLLEYIAKYMPYGPQLYPEDDLSEHPLRFFVSELIREQLFLLYHEEIPYNCAIEIAKYDEGEDMDRIHAEVVVGRNSQKGIIIGKGGTALKRLGIKSRESIEAFIEKKVFLDLHVKVRDKWRTKDIFLKNFGYKPE